MSNIEIIGKRIKEVREIRCLTQHEIAEKLDMKRTNIANYESGRVIPPSNVLVEISKILNVSADYLLGLSDNEGSISHSNNQSMKYFEALIRIHENTKQFVKAGPELHNAMKYIYHLSGQALKEGEPYDQKV